jgi:hypothetical protein
VLQIRPATTKSFVFEIKKNKEAGNVAIIRAKERTYLTAGR